MPAYHPPLDRLLDREILEFGKNWPDYIAEYGLAPEHIPDLIRMAGDPVLYAGDSGAHYSATIHARRALGDLQAVEAVPALIAAQDTRGEFDDYFTEELPKILARIGPAAIPAVAARLEDRRDPDWTRITCAAALEEIAKVHPDARDECVAILTRQLARKEDHEGSWALNGFIVSSLCDLKAVESAGVIEDAFAADVVDQSVQGGWSVVRFELGLGPEPKGWKVPERWRIPIDPRIFRGMPRRPDPKKLMKKAKAARKPSRRHR